LAALRTGNATKQIAVHKKQLNVAINAIEGKLAGFAENYIWGPLTRSARVPARPLVLPRPDDGPKRDLIEDKAKAARRPLKAA
jgi:hypothetical protein